MHLARKNDNNYQFFLILKIIFKREKMKLSELHKGDRALIKKIDTEESLKTRLASFAVVRGSELTVEACSIGKQTIEILVDDTLIGLRAEEAKKIEVERL
jgi:Fe2+ transport system protein FeoA